MKREKLTSRESKTLKTLLKKLRDKASQKDCTNQQSSLIDCCTFLIETLEGPDG